MIHHTTCVSAPILYHTLRVFLSFPNHTIRVIGKTHAFLKSQLAGIVIAIDGCFNRNLRVFIKNNFKTENPLMSDVSSFTISFFQTV
jgi:hypothetical protein